MLRHLVDEAMHLQGHPSIGGVPCGLGAKLDQMEGLPGVHLHDEANLERKRDDVLGYISPDHPEDFLMERTGLFHDPAKVGGHARFLKLGRTLITEPCAQALPLDRHQAMTLQVAKSAKVTSHIKPVNDSL